MDKLPKIPMINPRCRQLNVHSQSPYKPSTQVVLSKSLIKEHDVVNNVLVQVVKMYRHVSNVKDKGTLFRSFKWVQGCSNNYKKLVQNVKVKGKSSNKVTDVEHAKVRKY